jgi:hypothetical protein
MLGALAADNGDHVDDGEFAATQPYDSEQIADPAVVRIEWMYEAKTGASISQSGIVPVQAVDDVFGEVTIFDQEGGDLIVVKRGTQKSIKRTAGHIRVLDDKNEKPIHPMFNKPQ